MTEIDALTPNVEELGTQRTTKFDQPSISTQTSFVVADVPVPKPTTSKNEDSKTSSHIPSKIPLLQQNIEDDIVDKLFKNTTAELQTIKSDVRECLSILEESKKDILSFDEDQQRKSPEKNIESSEKPKKQPPRERITPRSKSSTPRSDISSSFKNLKQITKQKTVVKAPLPEKQRIKENDNKYLSVQFKLGKKPAKSDQKTIETFSPISEEVDEESPAIIVCNKFYKKSTEHKTIQTEFVKINSSISDVDTNEHSPESPKNVVIFPNENKIETIRDDSEKQPLGPNIISKIDDLLEILNEQSSDKKSQLSVQTLPAVDIRRPLITQKMPDVVIQPCTCTDQENVINYDNVKYLEYVHGDVSRISKPLDLKQQSPKKRKESPIILNVSADIILDDVSNDSLEQIEENAKVDNQPKEKEITNIPLENKKNVSIKEELYVNLEDIPSVRTLKEIQNYLEQRCSLIKERLEQERDLKPGECMSLKWKLNQPPRWKSSSPTKNNVAIPPEPSTSKYSQPISKNVPSFHPEPYLIDKSVQYSNSNSSKSEPEISHKKIEKENHIVILEDIHKNILFNKGTQYSLQSNISKPKKLDYKKIELSKFTEQFSLRSCKVVQEKEIQTTNLKPKLTDAQCSPRKMQQVRKNETGVQTFDLERKDSTTQYCPLNITKLELTSKTEFVCMPTPINEKKDCNTQTCLKKPILNEAAVQKDISPKKIMKSFGNEVQHDLLQNIDNICPSCEVNEQQFGPEEIKIQRIDSTTQCSPPNIVQPTLSQSETEIISLQPSIVQMKHYNTEISSEETQTCLSPKAIKKSIQSTVNKARLKLKCPTHLLKNNEKSCCIKEPGVADDNYISQDVNEPRSPEQQFSPAQKINIDNYKINKQKILPRTRMHNTKYLFRSVEFDSSSESSASNIIKQKNRRVQQKIKKCSTPIASSSTSANDNCSLSEGEVRLPCECSTSIGEIHLCHFANNIRKRVQGYKDKPEKLIKQTMHSDDIKFAYGHKHNDNWVTYYVTKTNRSLSSGEIGTFSNLSSVKSSD